MTLTVAHQASSSPPPVLPIRVSVIEESDELAELLCEALDLLLPDSPCEVTVYKGLVPLEVLDSSRPQLVIIDPHVGEGSEAWEAIGRAQAHPVLRHVPIIVCTTGAAVTSQANDGSPLQIQFLTKPFALDELERALKGAGL